MRKFELEIPNLHGKIPINKTTSFLLPTLDFANKQLNLELFKSYGFINSYLWYESDDLDFRQCLYLLFNPSFDKMSTWYSFHEMYSKEWSFKYDYDHSYYIIVLVFRIPDKFKNFPRWLMKGKYSHFGEQYAKKFIINTPQFKQQTLLQYNVIMQTEELRKKLSEELGFEVTKEIEYESLPLKENEFLYNKNLEI